MIQNCSPTPLKMQTSPSLLDGSDRRALSGRAVRRSDLSPVEMAAMYSLLARHFDGVTPDTFQRDLAEKTCVVLVEDAAGRLRGFSTFLIYATTVGGRPVTVVYSGDTIVEPSAWGSPALPRAWIRAVRALRCEYPHGELYWLLLTSGFRTYRFMSVFCRAFYPRYDEATPPATKAMLDTLSVERFGSQYDPAAGVVRFTNPQVLRDDLVDIPEGRCGDPHVKFFVERNPGHAAGDELVSLSSLADDNLTAAGRRMVR